MKFKIALVAILLCGGMGLIFFPSSSNIKSDSKKASTSAAVTGKRLEASNTAIAKQGRKEISSKTKAEPLTPADAKSKLAEFYSKNSDLIERGQFAADLIKKLCADGYSSEAWDLIDKGNGTVRNYGLSTFFSNADLPVAVLLTRISDDISKFDSSVCLSGFLGRYPPEQFLAVLDSPEMKHLFTRMGDDKKFLHVNLAVSTRLQKAMKEQPKNAAAFYDIGEKLNADGFIEGHDYILMVKNFSGEDVFGQWDAIKSIKSNEGNEEIMRKQKIGIISEMVAANAKETIKTILGQDSDAVAENLDLVISSWANMDSEGAGEWYSTNQSALSMEQRNLVASSFAKAAAGTLEFDSATQWAEQIQNEELRISSLAAIEEKRLHYEQKSLQR